MEESFNKDTEEKVESTNQQQYTTSKPPKTKDEIIAENEIYFKFYLLLPILTTVVVALGFFILGILDGITWQGYLINVENPIVWWLIGAVNSLITYYVTKLALSAKILHIYYLKDIREKLNEKEQ